MLELNKASFSRQVQEIKENLCHNGSDSYLHTWNEAFPLHLLEQCEMQHRGLQGGGGLTKISVKLASAEMIYAYTMPSFNWSH